MGPCTVVEEEAQRECVLKSDAGTVENTESAVSWSLGRAPCVGSTRGQSKSGASWGPRLELVSVHETRGCCRVGLLRLAGCQPASSAFLLH
jgi:hypothetical protein